MKKVLIDVTTLSDQYANRGIGTYTRNIVSELVKYSECDWHMIGFEDVKEQFGKFNTTFHSLGAKRLSTPQNIITFKRLFLPKIKKINPDLYFAPYFERGLPIGACKTVVMMHDVYPLISGKFSPKGFIPNFLKGLFYKYNLKVARKADAILTNSNFTKNEIEKVGFDPQKTTVTHLALSKDFDLSVLEETQNRDKVFAKYFVQKPYILYYGGLESNKNVDTLLEAFSKLCDKRELYLVILDKKLYRENGDVIAESPEAERIKKIMLKKKIINNCVLPKFVKWEHLPILQAESDAFVHLSEYEGFGFAVLEGISSGAAVIAADRSCYGEILGDGALLVDPKNVSDLVAGIERVIDDKGFRSKLIKKGLNQAKKYSWKKTGEETIKVIKQII